MYHIDTLENIGELGSKDVDTRSTDQRSSQEARLLSWGKRHQESSIFPRHKMAPYPQHGTCKFEATLLLSSEFPWKWITGFCEYLKFHSNLSHTIHMCSWANPSFKTWLIVFCSWTERRVCVVCVTDTSLSRGSFAYHLERARVGRQRRRAWVGRYGGCLEFRWHFLDRYWDSPLLHTHLQSSVSTQQVQKRITTTRSIRLNLTFLSMVCTNS